MTNFAPATINELKEALQTALADNTTLSVHASGTKAGLGAPHSYDATLDVSGLQGIISYEPEELIITAHAATPLASIETALAEKNQMLAFEPPHISTLYKTSHDGTIGGLLATNLSGSRRISAGAARDYLLGFEAVSGRGEIFRSGSKVMKNVTGYDLSKLMCGSFGTLAVMDEVTIKVLPAPETSLTLIIGCATVEQAGKAARHALQTAYEPSAVAILPKGAHPLSQSMDCALIRLEGVAVSVADRQSHLSDILGSYGMTDILEGEPSQLLWQSLSDGAPVADKGNQIWRVSCAPTAGPAILQNIQSHCDCTGYFDWAGGLLWLATDDETAHRSIREALHAQGGGHATLMRADDQLRRTIPVFEPQEPALAALNKRVQDSFDPHGILNPGRL